MADQLLLQTFALTFKSSLGVQIILPSGDQIASTKKTILVCKCFVRLLKELITINFFLHKVLNVILPWNCTGQSPSVLSMLVPCGKKGLVGKYGSGSTGVQAAMSTLVRMDALTSS